MNMASIFTGFVFAAEVIISPLPDSPKPTVSFGQLTPVTANVLGATNTVPLESATPTPLSPIPLLTPQATPPPTPTPTVLPSQSPTPTLTPTPTPPSRTTARGSTTIALLGDSMIDTLGPTFPALEDLIHKTYPSLDTQILNYGVGATNIDYGVERITHDYEYLGHHVPSLVSQNPDIVVIESFGYNPYPFDEGAINKHWLALAQAVDTIKQHLPNARIIIAATIAPSSKLFGDGAEGLSFSAEGKWQKANTIRQYLESTIKFAQGEHLPLADVYHPSLMGNGDGNPIYINPRDHIHPSDEGRALFARVLMNLLVSGKYLE